MSTITKLITIVQFDDVPAGGTVSKPHGLNKIGMSATPDYMERITDGFFEVTADEIDVTVTNTGATAADIAVLARHWHSSERQLGTVDPETDLAIQPWQHSDQALASKPACQYVWAPEHPLGNHSNVYADWESLYAAIRSTLNRGERTLFFDPEFSTDTSVGPNSMVIPAGTADNGAKLIPDNGILPEHYAWDMTDVNWKSRDSRASDDPEARVTFADFAYIHNLNWCEFINSRIYNKSTVHSPFTGHIRFTNGKNLFRIGIRGVGALPVYDQTDPNFFTVIELSGVRLVKEDGATGPVLQANDSFLFSTHYGDGIIAGFSSNDSIKAAGSGGAFGNGWQMEINKGNVYDKNFNKLFTADSDNYNIVLRGNQWAFKPSQSTHVADFTSRYFYVELVNTVGGAVVATFPPALGVEGCRCSLKDIGGNALAANITVVAENGTDVIEDPVIAVNGQAKHWMSAPDGRWIRILTDG